MSLPLKEQLNALVDRTFSRNGETFTVQRFHMRDHVVKIYTTTGTFEKHEDQVPALLRTFSEVTAPIASAPSRPQALPTAVTISSRSKLQVMQDALLSALQKVQVDAHFVEQAEQVSKLVQTGINLAKLELDAIRLANQKP